MSREVYYYPLTTIDTYVEIQRVRSRTLRFSICYMSPAVKRLIGRGPSQSEGYYEIYKARLRAPEKYVYLLQIQYTVLPELELAFVSDLDLSSIARQYIRPVQLPSVILELLRYTASLVDVKRVYLVYSELSEEARRLIDLMLPDIRRYHIYKLKS